MAADDRWYFTAEKIKDSPSRKCGIDADKELSYRQQAANLIQDMGQSLNVNQLCMNTAIVYMHRFYMFHSFTKYKWNSMAACCLFLGAKVEEQPRKLEHVIKVHHSCLHRDSSPLDTMKDRYLEIAQEMVVNENILLQTLGFDIGIEQPNSHVVNCCELVRASRDLAQTSYFMANESLHLTTMCLQYKPTVVACVCIHLACKWGKWELPKSSEDRPWFWYVDRSVSVELLEELTSEFLGILEKSPNRLKRKLMNARKDGEFGHLHKKEGSSSSHGEHSVKKDMRNHDKNYRESASSSGQASSSSMPSHPSAHSSSSNHKKRLLPGDEKASPSNPLHGADRPQKKPKVDGHSLSIDEWKERREKEKMQHKIPVDHMKHNSSQMPHMKQMEKSRQPYDKHRPHHGEHHHRTDHKNVVPHRENHKAEHDKNRHHRPPYHKERLPSDKYHMMKHPGSGHDQSHIVKSKLPVKAEVNDLKKSDSVPRVPPPQTHIDEGRLKPPIESASLNQASNISRSNNDQKNMSSDKLFDDLMNASNPIHTGPPPDIFASSNVKNDIVFNSSVNENFAKQDSRTIYPVSTNGDEAADASLSVPRTSPKRRLHSNSQKTPPSSDIRRSNRHKTPPLTSPVGDLKTISPMKEPSSAGSSDMQPVVKITRMEMDKQSIPDAPVDIRVPSTVVHDNLNAHGYQSSSESMSANQFIMQLPIRKEPVVMDKSLESRQHLETVPIVSKHKEKSKKDRHKSSKKEKHRHKHSHSDSHREKNHSLKISIPKDKISMSDNNPVESGGGLKLKIHKGRLANDVSENENSVNAVGGGLKLVIHKSKIGSGGGADTNGTAIKSERKRDRSPRQKSPKLSRSHKHQSVEESDEFIQVQNPYYMPPFKSESGYYANAQQYCPAPAAIHPATANTTVRPPSISGYTMYGSAYQQHQQPPLPSLPPPQPPPPPTK